MLHPIDSWPSLSDEHEPVLYNGEGQEVEWARFDCTGLYQAGDGSCIPHCISELSRAAYSWVSLMTKATRSTSRVEWRGPPCPD
eukprot:5427185-Pyramimonas_sp.AAC.1